MEFSDTQPNKANSLQLTNILFDLYTVTVPEIPIYVYSNTLDTSHQNNAGTQPGKRSSSYDIGLY
jgi:hypothetical protein